MSSRDPFDRRAKRSPVRTFALWIAVAAAVPAGFGFWFWVVETYIDGPSQTFWALGGIWLTFFLIGLVNVPTILRAFGAAYAARPLQPNPKAGFTPLEVAVLQEFSELAAIHPGALAAAFVDAEVSLRINTGSGCVTEISGVHALPAPAMQPSRIVALELSALPLPVGATLWSDEDRNAAMIEIFTGGQDTCALDWISVDFVIKPSGSPTPPAPEIAPIAAVLESDRHFADRTARELYR